MDELNLYQGAATGREIDEAVKFTTEAIDDMFFSYAGKNIVAYVPVAVGNSPFTYSIGAYGICDNQLSSNTSELTIPTSALVHDAIETIENRELIKVVITNVSSLPATYTRPPGQVFPVDDTTELISAVLSNPAAQIGAWTVTTATRSVTVDGSISGTTDITLYLAKPRYSYT